MGDVNLFEPLIDSTFELLNLVCKSFEPKLEDNIKYNVPHINNYRIPIGKSKYSTIYYEPFKSPHMLVGGCTRQWEVSIYQKLVNQYTKGY